MSLQLTCVFGTSKFGMGRVVQIQLANLSVPGVADDMLGIITCEAAEREGNGNRCSTVIGVRGKGEAEDIADAVKHIVIRWRDWANRYEVDVTFDGCVRAANSSL